MSASRSGDDSNIQEGAVLHTDIGFPLRIGKRVSVGHQAALHGCHIGDGTLVGIQAVVMNGAAIGKNCIVGAGAVVTQGKVFPTTSSSSAARPRSYANSKPTT